jgi:hypothetical protein
MEVEMPSRENGPRLTAISLSSREWKTSRADPNADAAKVNGGQPATCSMDEQM